MAHLVVVGDTDELAKVSLSLGGDLHEVLAAVGHLHDAHAGALVVDEILLALLQHIQGQARGAGGEVKLALRGRGGADGDAGAARVGGDGGLARHNLLADDGAGAESHGGGHAESSHRCVVVVVWCFWGGGIGRAEGKWRLFLLFLARGSFSETSDFFSTFFFLFLRGRGGHEFC